VMRNKTILAVVFLFFFVFALFSTASADEITAYKQGWYDGYRKGYKDAFTDFSNKMAEYRELVDAIFDYKNLLFAGKIQPVRLQIEYTKSLTPSGVRYQRTLVAENFDGEVLPLEFLKKRFEEAERRTSVISGWWAYVDTSHLAREDIGLLDFIAQQSGYSPRHFQSKLIFSIEANKAAAERVSDVLKRYGIASEVRHVEINK